MQESNKQPLLAHLDEFRIRLTKSLLALVVAIVISFPLARYIFPILMEPVSGVNLYYFDLTGLFSPYIKICLYIALAISGPYILYHIVMFINPALRRQERAYLYTLLPATIVLFICGALFCYFVLLPPGLNFLYRTFPEWVGGGIDPMWSVTDYVSKITQLCFWIGVVFEIPLLMFFLSKIRVISPEWVLRKWKWAVVLAFVLGAMITPTPDPVNQTLVAAPILVLYGLGCVLAKIARAGLPFRSKKHES
jgi:sec-independent protein translocase protein TatC